MPAWDKDGGLHPAEIESVIAYLQILGNDGQASIPGNSVSLPQSTLSPAAGRRVFEAACSGCHGMNGEGGEGPALNNPVLLAHATDAYLIETISRGRRRTSMPSFAESSPVNPTLTLDEIQAVAAYIRSWQIPAGGKQ